jgi:hypothetical protein
MDRQPNCQRRYRAHGDEPSGNAHADLTLCTRGNYQSSIHGEVVLKEKLSICKEAEERGSINIWWKRLWVIQEYHFSAPKRPIVYIGPHSTDWVSPAVRPPCTYY